MNIPSLTGRFVDGVLTNVTMDPPYKERLERIVQNCAGCYNLSPEDIQCMDHISSYGYQPKAPSGLVGISTLFSLARVIKRLVPVAYVPMPDAPVTRGLMPKLPEKKAALILQAENDQRHFWNMLVFLMTLVPFPKRDHISILDIGCGDAWDAMPLHSFFDGARYGKEGKNVDYTGVDLNTYEIKGAIDFNKDRPYLKFEEADATDLGAHESLNRKFDVIVIRHPEVFRRRQRYIHPTWFKMYKEAVDHLAEGGIIIVTTFLDFEHNATQRAFSCFETKQIVNVRNPFSATEPFYMYRDWSDQFIAVYIK